MSYMIAKQQNIITLKAIEYFENNFNAQQQLRLDMDALQKDKVDRDTYYNNQNIYTLVTNAYAKAQSRAKEDVNKLLTSITAPRRNIYIYKVLIDKGSNSNLSNTKEVRDEYNNFNSIVTNNFRTINKKYHRSTKALTIQVSNTATEHAFRDNFTSILLHNHALLLTNNKIPTKEIIQVIASKLPDNYNVQVQEFNKYKSSEQLIINDNNRYDKQVRTSLTNWLAYMYKTFAQKPFKNYVELAAFEQLSLEQRYNLIRAQQLITKGIRKHKTLAIHFPSTKVPKLRIKYLQYIPIITYDTDKQPTYTPVINTNNIHLTCSNSHSKAHTALFTYIANYLTLTTYNTPIIDTG